jgi:hypothetical protein
MGYRAVLEATSETVQEVTLAAERRLDEAMMLFSHNRYHTAIYVGGLSAEMFLKTACFMVGGANLTDPVAALMAPLKSKRYTPPFKGDFESGHGLWFWSQELLARRHGLAKRTPNRFMQVLASLYGDWFVPGDKTCLFEKLCPVVACLRKPSSEHNSRPSSEILPTIRNPSSLWSTRIRQPPTSS